MQRFGIKIRSNTVFLYRGGISIGILSVLLIGQMCLACANCCDHSSFCDILGRGENRMAQWMTPFATAAMQKFEILKQFSISPSSHMIYHGEVIFWGTQANQRRGV